MLGFSRRLPHVVCGSCGGSGVVDVVDVAGE